MEKAVCYILSGLGADERVFEQIDFGSFSPVFIPWEPTKQKHDQSLESYAKQLSRHVKVSNPILIGISFGGIVAQEMSSLFGNCPVLIISSVKTRSELPLFMRLSGITGLHKLLLTDSDPVFTKWAIHQVSNWKRTEKIPAKVLHIHGEADRIFPIGNVAPDYIIPGGTHFMTVSEHERVSEAIQEALEKLSESK